MSGLRLGFALAGLAAFLAACSSTAPKVEADYVPVKPAISVSEVHEAAEDSVTAPEPEFKPVQNLDSTAKVPEEELLPIPAQTDTLEARAVDPFVEIQKVVAATFLHAKELSEAGENDSLKAYLERLTVLSPLWDSWMARANAMLEPLSAPSERDAETFRRLALSIVNENAASSDYKTVSDLADSLLAMNPGDSLSAFAEAQKALAYERTVKKIKAEMLRADSLAEAGNFAAVDSLTTRLILRYREFETELSLPEFRDSASRKAAEREAGLGYWKEHSAAAALKEAAALAEQGDFARAKELYARLLSSPEAKAAQAALDSLSNSVCVVARKKASELYAKTVAEKSGAKKLELVKAARESLLKCTENFPNEREAARARSDLKLLEAELESLGAEP